MRFITRASFGLLVVGLCLVACNPATDTQPARLDDTPRVILLSAFPPEAKTILSHLQVTRAHVINGRTYYLGQMAGTDVVFVTSGMSTVNATMTTQIALDHFNARAIVFSGIAGGVNPNLSIGDVVVPGQWAEYHETVFAREAADGWQVFDQFGKPLANYGMMFTVHVYASRKGATPDAEEERFWFSADPQLLQVAKRVTQVQLSRCTDEGHCLTRQPKIVVGGNGVSGPTFVDNAKYRDWVWQNFQVNAVDMESAAVAHVAYVNGVPFIAFRSLSDLAGGGPGENELWTFFELAASNSAIVVETFLREWASDKGAELGALKAEDKK